jgi:hypothetical protein
MDKQDLIYDIVVRLEEKFDNRMCDLEKDVSDLKQCKNRLLGFIGCITLVFTIITEYVKGLFH